LDADCGEQKVIALHLVNAEMREMAAARDWLDPEWELLCECGTCQ
jgi:hypothetical protein